ncbi:cyclin-O [Gadus morhua]|uniref:Cyclin O n=1 Tax=Gadus morhua TaxID=8049 RepID=A0A8C5A1L8_GADMO|nr:cyclin-O [Gadus morhua]
MVGPGCGLHIGSPASACRRGQHIFFLSKKKKDKKMVSMANNTPNATPAVVCKQSPKNYRSAFQNKTRSPIQKKEKRHRKQTITSRLSDSGIEEDLSAQSPVGTVVLSGEGPSSTGQLGLLTWHQHYGSVGYKIQKDNETQFHLPKCLARQPQVTPEARCKLVSWLIPVHKYFRLSFECCCLAVNIMDRFLASTAVAADCFQLLGVTALLLASKQVEVFSPRISQLLGLCCHAFSKQQLCNLECLILLRLRFRLAAPTLAFFLEYNILCSEAVGAGSGSPSARWEMRRSPRRSDLARRICELSLADYAFNRYLPSLTAVCAMRLSLELLAAGGQPEEPNARMSCTHDLIQSEKGTLSGTSEGELSEGEQLWMDCTPDESGDGPGHSAEGFGPEEPGPLSGGLDGRTSRRQNLALECTENLKLLVSLNRETIQAMLTTS